MSAQAQSLAQAQGGPPRPQHGKELCLLSLDGGGVRGLSALCILEELMRKVDAKNPPRPSEYFDLMGGTSTGGLIAIMLGRLQMSIEECRQAYRELSEEAFQQQNYTAAPAFKLPWNWDLKARFDSAALERGMKRIIVAQLRQDPANEAKSDKELEDTLLKDPKSKCKVFVTATSASMPDRTSILTNYESDRWPPDFLDSVKIWEAARATSAASTFFEPIQIGPDNETFLDGATGANNPINVVWDEARDIWPSDKPLEDDVQCVISVGTGVASVKAFGSSLKEVGETLKNMSVETEKTAEAFLRRYTRLHTEERYFRFNVLSGLGDIGLEEASKRPEIVQATRRYITSEEPKKHLENCAKNLRFRDWYKALPRILERAEKTHTASINRLKAYGTSPDEDTDGPPMWFVHMPEYQRWIKSGHGTLCYLDSDGAKMSALVSNIVKMGLSLHPVLSQTIYLDCSQYDTSNPAEAEMGALHSLIYQNIFLHPGSLERLSEYFKTIRQPVGRSFNRLFHENMDEGVQPDCGFMVDALRWVIPVDGLPSFTIIDKIDCMTREASQRMLGRLLSKINDEADHILFVGHNDPDLAAKFEGLPTISPRVEAMHCIGSLHFQEWDDRRSIVETPFGDTDEWIWTDPAFVTWRERSGILWIKGKPGCGKSTIARMITDRLARPKERQSTINPAIADPDPDSTIAVNFFYSARMGERATRHYYMLRSILYQMLRQDYSLYVHFKCTYRRILGDGTTWMLEDLMYVFETIIADCSSERPSLCCVLDGFDESDEIECPQPGSQKSKKTQTSMLSWLADLALKQTHGSWLKILVLSRPTTSISRALGAIASITVEEHNLPAIIKLIEDGLSKIKQSITEWIRTDCGGFPDAEQYIQTQQNDADATLQHLRSRLLEKADGTIQWVVTVLSELQSQFDRKGVYTRGELEDVLDSLPKGLDELYEELVKRLQKRLTVTELQKAHNMLAWTCFARRPLTLDEFRDALALDGWEKPTSLDQLQKHLDKRRLRLFQAENWAPVEREIIDTCGCLLEVVKPASASIKMRSGVSSWWTRAECTVQVTHQTVKEFLLHGGDKAGPLQLVDEQCSSYILAGVSTYFRSSVLLLEHALDREFGNTESSIPEDPPRGSRDILDYPESAFKSVAEHLQDRPLLAYIFASIDSHSAYKDLFTSEETQVQEMMDRYVKRRLQNAVVEKVAPPLNHFELEQPPISLPLKIESTKERGYPFDKTPARLQTLVNYSREREDRVLESPTEVWNPQRQFAELSFDDNDSLYSSTTTESSLSQSSFTPSIEDGKEQFSEQRFAQVISQIFGAACEGSFFTVLRLLFESNLCYEWSIRHHCIKSIEDGNLPVADELLSRANFSSTTNSVSHNPLTTVFSWVVKRDEDDAVRLLLHHNSRLVYAKDEDKLTALHYAASHGSTKCAQDLFKYRPAIDSADCTGRTPLIIAAKNGHNDLVELLLKCGADHTLRDSSGRTALYHAIYSSDARTIRALLSRGDMLDCVNEALKAAFDSELRGGYAAENRTHRQNYGFVGRRYSWPSTPDFSQATCSRRDERQEFPLKRQGLDSLDGWYCRNPGYKVGVEDPGYEAGVEDIESSEPEESLEEEDAPLRNNMRLNSWDHFRRRPSSTFLPSEVSPILLDGEGDQRWFDSPLGSPVVGSPSGPLSNASWANDRQKRVSYAESSPSRITRRYLLRRTLSDDDFDTLNVSLDGVSPSLGAGFDKEEHEYSSADEAEVETILPSRGVMGTIWPGVSRLPKAELSAVHQPGSTQCLRQDSID